MSVLPPGRACTTAKTGRKIVLHEHDDHLRAEYAKHRPNVERVVAQVTTRDGCSLKLRNRGTTKNNAWLKSRTAAVNLRNLIHRGLDRANSTWVVATT